MGAPRRGEHPWRIQVAPIREPGLAVDAGGVLEVAVRTALSRGGFESVASDGDLVLRIDVVAMDAQLAPFAEPGLRAAQYRVNVRLVGQASGGSSVWTSPLISAEAPIFGPPGRLEALDGAHRRALERAAESAAEQLVVALSLHLSR